MEWAEDKIEEIVEYVNGELALGRAMVNIEQEEFHANERVIDKRIKRRGYRKINNQYVLSNEIVAPKQIAEISITKDVTESKNSFEDLEVKALKELIENKDAILKLLNRDITKSNAKSNVNVTKSFRVDSGLYKEFKKVADKRKDKLVDILNNMLEQYVAENKKK